MLTRGGFALFAQRMREAGLQIIDEEMDGNCMFRCLARQSDMHPEARARRARARSRAELARSLPSLAARASSHSVSSLAARVVVVVARVFRL